MCTNLKFLKKGSHGILLYDSNDINYVYKITILSDIEDFNSDNIKESMTNVEVVEVKVNTATKK